MASTEAAGAGRPGDDQTGSIRRRLDALRREPDAPGDRWLLGLIPAQLERIDSAEWYGTPELLARFLEATLGPLPPRLAAPAELLATLRRVTPALRSWGYVLRIGPLPDGGEAVLIDGTDGRAPEALGSHG